MIASKRNENREKIKSMPGFKVHWACVRFMQCDNIFQRNSEKLIKYSRTPPTLDYQLMPDIKSRMQKNALDCETVRLIHNYVASAKTLVDISRCNSKKYLNEGLKNKYNKIVSDTFANDPCTKIIHKLRNFMLHVDMPQISNQMNIFTGVSSCLAIPPEKLIDWDGWNTIEKGYLEMLIKNGETIKIHEFFLAYTNKTKCITNLLLKAITDNNDKELTEVYDLHDQILDGTKEDGYVTDPLFIHFFSRNKQYDENGKIVPIFKEL